MIHPSSPSVLRVELPQWVDPAEAFLALFGTCEYAFWLDGGAHAEAGVSYMGAPDAGGRVLTASVKSASVAVTTITDGASIDPSLVLPDTTVFDFLRAEVGTPTRLTDATHEGNHHLPSFQLGWVGWLGYELGAAINNAPSHQARTPDAALIEVDRCLEFNHESHAVSLVMRAGENPDADAASIVQWRDAVLERLSVQPELPVSPGLPAPSPSAVTWRHSPDRYAELIAECQAAIHCGDAYQLCLTNEIRVEYEPGLQINPLDTYLRMRAASPTHHGGFLRIGETALLSASPEQFLAVTAGGHITTKPIKGTRRRASSIARDLELRAELESSDKERAENLMIVDLMRNDLGKIGQLGSVMVSKLLAVESYAHVHQLVSTIEARLADGLSSVDAVEASFPAGSMTGAPKISAVTILDGLEAGPRGIYSGAFGYFGLDGAVDLAMVIRSIVLDATGASIGTGGGITALSVAAEEIEETQIKAAALLAVLGAA